MTTNTNQREQAVKNALASVRMEGLEPSTNATAIFQRFVDGELTLAQMDSAFDNYLNSLNGFLPLSRNAGTQQ